MTDNQNKLADLMAREIMAEIDAEIVRDLRAAVAGEVIERRPKKKGTPKRRPLDETWLED